MHLQCDYCSSVFFKVSDLIIHKKESHPISCEICGLEFTSSWKLSKHSDATHKRNRKQCLYCKTYFPEQYLHFYHLDDCRELELLKFPEQADEPMEDSREAVYEPVESEPRQVMEQNMVVEWNMDIEVEQPVSAQVLAPQNQAPLPLVLLPNLCPQELEAIKVKQYLISKDVSHSGYLLLENYGRLDGEDQECKSTECFMNCLAQLLYSVVDLREPIMLNPVLREIFAREIPSTRRWRKTLPPQFHRNQHDISDVYDAIMTKFRDSQINLLPIECKTALIRRCPCQGAPKEKIQEFSALTVINGLFLRALEKTTEAKTCQVCGRNWSKGKWIEPSGNFHIMKIQYRFEMKENQTEQKKFITDLDFNSVVLMFGSMWRIRSFVIRQQDPESPMLGHYTTFVRVEDRFVYIDDDVAYTDQAPPFEDLDVKLVVFEKVDPKE